MTLNPTVASHTENRFRTPKYPALSPHIDSECIHSVFVNYVPPLYNEYKKCESIFTLTCV